MHFLVYIYSNKLPGNEFVPFRCPRCGRIVFRTNSKFMQLSNAYGAAVKDLPPSINAIEHKCHSCKSVYQILFQ